MSLRGAIRRAVCRHKTWQHFHAKGTGGFGIDPRDGRSHALTLAVCLRCGSVRAHGISSSKAPVGRNPEGQDPQGLGAEHEHAVPAEEQGGAHAE